MVGASPPEPFIGGGGRTVCWKNTWNIGFQRKAQRLFVEECHTPVVETQSAQHDNTKSRGLQCVNPICDICMLQDAQVNIRMVHPMQRQLKAAIADVLDNVGPETDDIFFFCLPSHVETPVLQHIPYQHQYLDFHLTRLWIFPFCPTNRPLTLTTVSSATTSLPYFTFAWLICTVSLPALILPSLSPWPQGICSAA